MCQHPAAAPSQSCCIRRRAKAGSNAMMVTSAATAGDVCTIELDLQANNGFIPENLFDMCGRISFVVDHGHYLPALHEMVRGRCASPTTRLTATVDAGYGDYRKDLLLTVPLENLKRFVGEQEELAVGSTLTLPKGVTVRIAHINEDAVVTLDANPPLAGSSYDCTLTICSVEPSPWSTTTTSKYVVGTGYYETATFALGCFWGAELFFMRQQGVVGTRVGHEGSTEVVQVLYDVREISYRTLLLSALERVKELSTGRWLWDEDIEDDETDDRYRQVIYYHTAEQLRVARKAMFNEHRATKVAVVQWSDESFRLAGEDQQQYLYKGGQTARKGAKEPIRCFG